MRLSILCWDPSSGVQMALPALELPVHCGDQDSRFLLRIMDAFMAAASEFVVGLVYDAATPHQTIRRLLHGTPTVEDLALVGELDSSLKFFNRISYKDLPPHNLPRLPIRVAMVEGQVYFGVCGPCSLMVHYGSFIFICLVKFWYIYVYVS